MRNLPAALRDGVRILTAKHYPIQQEGVTFHCALTLAKRKNLALQYASRTLLPLAEPALPHILHVGVTTMCNLSCPACPTGTGSLGRPGVHLDFDTYSKTIDELRDSLLFALFWDWGEPLMHPRLAEMIAYAGRGAVKSVVSTNGTVANTEPQLERLVLAQPSVVIVCVDGADQETHEQYRAGAALTRVLETIRLLRKIKDRLGTPYPAIEFRVLATSGNQHQMAQLLELAQQCGADFFNVKSLRPYDYRGNSIDSQLVPIAPGLSRYAYGPADRTPAERLNFKRLGPLHCGKPHRAPTLNSDGTLSFCSYASDESEHFGAVRPGAFVELWRSQRTLDKRAVFDRQGGTKSCGTCFFRSDHKPTIMHTVPLRPLPPELTLVRPETTEEFLRAVSGPLALASR